MSARVDVQAIVVAAIISTVVSILVARWLDDTDHNRV